jgi:hypothetical protein
MIRFACAGLLAVTSLTSTTLYAEEADYLDDDPYYADPPDPNVGRPSPPPPRFIPPVIPNPWEIPDHWYPYPGLPRPIDATPWIPMRSADVSYDGEADAGAAAYG